MHRSSEVWLPGHFYTSKEEAIRLWRPHARFPDVDVDT